jgi:hypothetical protein
VTIDPATSRDLDQALCLRKIKGGYRVHYAIADVTLFAPRGGELEAETRPAALWTIDLDVDGDATAVRLERAAVRAASAYCVPCRRLDRRQSPYCVPPPPVSASPGATVPAWAPYSRPSNPIVQRGAALVDQAAERCVGQAERRLTARLPNTRTRCGRGPYAHVTAPLRRLADPVRDRGMSEP